MHMHISQSLNASLDLRLEQSFNHQQIQALELLTAPVFELETIINRELESNPALEEDFEEPEVRDDDEAWLDYLLKLDDEQRYVCGSRPRYTEEDEERRQHFMESATYQETLQDQLMAELNLMELDEDALAHVELVVYCLDDDGFLRSHPADLAMVAGCSTDQLEDAIQRVQALNPAGVAARDLRERLMLQLERQQRQDSLAYQIVAHCLDDLGKNLLPKIARRFKVDLDDVQDAIEEIQGLAPHLSEATCASAAYVREELEVIEEDGELILHVKNDFLPSLRISPQYREMLANPELPADARDYLKQKVRSAAFMINSILQRQSTIERIARAILAVQEDFFLHGPSAMKPLTMAQVAEAAQVHETTVSRAVAEKYLRCKFGLYPLKHFFSSGYTAADGSTVSSVAVRNAIRQLVESEDSEHPYSDGELASRLADNGLKVARRTVAKYRESINIPASNLRRTYCA